MANITYRGSTTTPPTPSSTTAPNLPLTNDQIDGNFKSLNDDIQTRSPLVSPNFSGTASIDNFFINSQLKTLHFGSIVKIIVYNTKNDNDYGVWTRRCTHTSWYNETLGFTGKWLGQKTNTASAWATSGALAGDGFQNTTDGKFYVLTGTNTASEIFRGNVRGFPSIVAVVAEASRVVIYDLTQPTCPMWMVVKTTNPGGAIFSGTVNSVAALNGTIIISASGALVGLLAQLRFSADFSVTANGTTNGYNIKPISLRNDTGALTTTAGFFASNFPVSRDCNDCAITVLETAPIDAATGLPVPTIAVATAGGVSVIKDDGTIVNSSHTGSIVRLSIVGTTLWTNFVTGVSSSFGFKELISINSNWSFTFITTPQTRVSPTDSSTAIANGVSTGGSNLGIVTLKHNPSTPAKGMVDYITNTYNSGWMVGDIRRALLADTTAETISASGELVTNGTFTTDTSGWTAARGATLSVSSGSLVITYGGTDYPQAQQSITTIAGRAYYIEATQSSGAQLSMSIGTAAGGNQLGSSAGSGRVGFYFLATSTTSHLTLQANATGSTSVTLDNVSCQLAEPDRCVKNKGLIVNGTLTKSAVATGANLVCYSGFTPSNYLEQPYSSDLDFGTGDFCLMGWESVASTTDQVYRFARDTVGGSSALVLYSATGGAYFIRMLGGGTISTGVTQTLGWNLIALVRESGTIKFYVNGVLAYSVNNAISNTSVTNVGAVLRIGTDCGATPVWSGVQKMALWRASATAPSANQIAHIYRTELPLFQNNAQCTIAGTSTSISAMSYDQVSTILHVGTSWGRSGFKDLTRIDSEASSVSSITSISANGGVILTGGTNSQVYIPSLYLRDELNRKNEALLAFNSYPVPKNFVATSNQTVFTATEGYSIKYVYINGLLKNEYTDYTIANDGFVESITTTSGIGVNIPVTLMLVRK